jgi:hypothetical protein
MLSGRLIAFVGLCLLGCGGRTDDATVTGSGGCETDLDCKGTRICVERECRDAGFSPVAGSSHAGAASSSSGGASSRGGASSGGVGNRPGQAGTSGTGGNVGTGVEPGSLELDASAMIADSARGRLYAVVTSSGARYANELVVIDAAKLAIEASLVVGSDPDALALSDDGSRLWVGLHGALSLREVDLTQWPPVAAAQYALPSGQFDDYAVHAGAMVVLPGEPQSVAVSLHYDGLSPSFAGVAIVDSGNPRPKKTSGHTGASLMVAGPPGYLFGFNDQHTGFEFYTLVVDAMGVTQTEHGGLISGFNAEIFSVGSNVISSGGEVVDVSKPNAPIRAGKFTQQGLVLPHVDPTKAIMLSTLAGNASTTSGSNRLVLRKLNLQTFREDSEVPLAGSYTRVHHFVQPLPNTFAFIDSTSNPFDATPKSSRIWVVSPADFGD